VRPLRELEIYSAENAHVSAAAACADTLHSLTALTLHCREDLLPLPALVALCARSLQTFEVRELFDGRCRGLGWASSVTCPALRACHLESPIARWFEAPHLQSLTMGCSAVADLFDLPSRVCEVADGGELRFRQATR
jgi:hypothetical protein